MAPEQFADAKNADERSDIYSLGCTLYFMLTGSVPFPGSSLAQKQQDHQQTDPPPIEQSTPHVPAGLAQTVYKMMAKKPADRFQSARECVEALTPYVAASSASLPNMQYTTNWEGSQLTIVSALRPRQRRYRKWAAIATLLVMVSTAIGFGVAHLFSGINKADNSNEPNESNEPNGTPIAAIAKTKGSTKTNSAKRSVGKKPAIAGKRRSEKKPNSAGHDPWVLTVSQNPQDGGRYRSINAAVKAVRPGQTIRILDAGTYRERILFDKRHNGVTLESTAGATLELAQPTDLIQIDHASDVTIRGLQFRVTGFNVNDLRGRPAVLIKVTDDCSGLLLQKLNANAIPAGTYAAIQIHGGRSSDPHRPIIIEKCLFRRAFMGVFLDGGLSPVTRNVLVANNTMIKCGLSFRVWEKNERVRDSMAKDRNIQVCGNLVLASEGPDMIFLNSGGQLLSFKGPGDVAALVNAWRFHCNWRETKTFTGNDVGGKAWIPPNTAAGDTIAEKIAVLSRIADDPRFLQPAEKSPLANGGVGGGLPKYAGAVSPQGTKP